MKNFKLDIIILLMRFQAVFFYALFIIFSILNRLYPLSAPITLPYDQSGLETTTIDKSEEYILKIKYLLGDIKKQYKDDSLYFIIPIPSSNESQIVTIEKTVNFEIADISRDIYGNAVIITKPVKTLFIPDFFEIFFNVNIDFIKYFTPKNYIYKIAANDFVIKGLMESFLDFFNKNLNDATGFDVKEVLSYNELSALIENYKNIINRSKNNFNKIYDEKIIEFYPITKEDYYKAASDFLAILHRKKIAGRISSGVNFPKKVDFSNYDFIVEIYLPSYGVIFLDMHLDIFANNLSFINIFYHTSLNDENLKYGYLGAVNNENMVNFTQAVIKISGKEKLNNEDKRLDYYIEKKSLIIDNVKFADFVDINNTFNKNKIKFNVFYKENNKREYFVKAKNDIIEKIIFSTGIENGKPSGVKNIFFAEPAIYAYAEFKDTSAPRSMRFVWVKPDGNKHYESIVNIPKGWSYTYAVLGNKAEYKLMRGVWTLEAFVNNSLDARMELELR